MMTDRNKKTVLMLTFWILPLLLVGCSVPRSFPSPITSLSPVPVEKNPVHGAILSVESVDTSLFRAMNVRNNLDIVYNATDFGPYLAKRITLHLAQSGLFQQVLLDPKPGSVPHLSLGLEVEQLELDQPEWKRRRGRNHAPYAPKDATG
jgi:hypothetical protein